VLIDLRQSTIPWFPTLRRLSHLHRIFGGFSFADFAPSKWTNLASNWHWSSEDERFCNFAQFPRSPTERIVRGMGARIGAKERTHGRAVAF
jgi:hypothetical protein